MSFRVPEFELEEENPVSPRKIHGSVEDDVVELLWQNGPFFRRRMADVPHSDSTGLSFLSNPCATSGVPTHSATAVAPLPSTTELYREEDEMASWLYYPLGGDDDPEGGGTIAGVSTPEQPREAAAGVFAEHGFFSPSAADRAAEADGWMTTGRPPRHPETPGKSASCLGVSQVLPASVDYTVVDSSATTTEPGRSPRRSESRVSSGDVRPGSAAMYGHGQASSSGVSCDGDEAGAAPAAARRGDERKRGARDGWDSRSEDGELESSGGKRRDSKRRASARRARAAEVHNLSERRRRDRINEKMRALQQLIPRCHKSDKASMLDDAIEYMKSLQMQVQMMSMCCSMTPVMFPGVQRYMPPMGVGMPMSMNMGMGMGMAMGMDMASGGFSHPMMPFPTAMPGHSPLAVNGGAAPMGQRVSMQAAYPRPAASLTEQVGPQPAGGLPADPVPGSTACVGAPSAVSQMLDLSAAHQARRQDPVSAAEPGISCEHTSIHDKSKLVG